jgi:hypothetical protein
MDAPVTKTVAVPVGKPSRSASQTVTTSCKRAANGDITGSATSWSHAVASQFVATAIGWEPPMKPARARHGGGRSRPVDQSQCRGRVSGHFRQRLVEPGEPGQRSTVRGDRSFVEAGQVAPGSPGRVDQQRLDFRTGQQGHGCSFGSLRTAVLDASNGALPSRSTVTLWLRVVFCRRGWRPAFPGRPGCRSRVVHGRERPRPVGEYLSSPPLTRPGGALTDVTRIRSLHP